MGWLRKLLTAEAHDYRDAGGRITHGAVIERTQRKHKNIHRKGRKDRKLLTRF
jgi:hypothetical protein